MLRCIKEAIEFILAVFCLAYLKVTGTKPHRLVIYYHGVNESDILSFRKQMECLANNYMVVRPSEIMVAAGLTSKIIVAITFDDAFVSVMKNAVPILKEFDLPAAIFAPVGNLEQKPHWNMPENSPDKNETVMSIEQIKQLDKDGFEIFSHTMSHSELTKIEDIELESELIASKQELERILNHEVVAISYPHGACNNRVCNVAKDAGYRLGFTIEPGVVESNMDNLRIGRFSVSPHNSLLVFKLKVSGAYQAVQSLRILKKSVLRVIGRCNTK